MLKQAIEFIKRVIFRRKPESDGLTEAEIIDIVKLLAEVKGLESATLYDENNPEGKLVYQKPIDKDKLH